MGGRILAVAAAAALLWVGGSAHARSTFTVDSTADTPGNCGVAGQCTLRAAIAAADAAGGSNIVTLPAGTYTLTAGALSVTGTLELDGAGAATTVIDGGGVDRVFDASTADGLSISGVRITGGSTPGASGGAILVNADTTLRNVTLQSNTSGQGGAIYAGAGNLTVVDSTISNNTATGSAANGGGIAFHGGTLRVLDSVVSNNTVTNTHLSLVGSGGGINAGGNLVLDSSTISGNSASGGAGAFAGGVAAGARTTITNSTISGNSAESVGAVSTAARTSIVNSTISGNTSTGFSQPGGISTNVAGLEIVDSTIADNSPENLTSLAHVRLLGDILSNPAGKPNCNTNGIGSFDSDGYNVSSDGSCHLLGPGDVENQDPLLGPLQDNGGGTQTRLPASGSPALGIFPAGVALPPTDQRGVFRPASGADAGAAEHASSTVGVTVSAPATVLSGETFDVVITLRNRSGSALTGVSVALGATTRTIGTLADGKSDVELFSVSASSPSTCAGAPLSLDFTAAWNGSTHAGSYPVHVTPNCGGVTGQVTASGLAVVGAKVDVCLTTLAVCTEVTTNGTGNYTASVPNGSYTVKAYPTASSPSNAAATSVGPVTVTAPTFTTQDVTLTAVTPPPNTVTVTTPSPPGSNGVPQVPRAVGATVTLTNPNFCGNPAPTTFSLQGGGGVVFTGALVQTGPTTYQFTVPTNLSYHGLLAVAVGCINFWLNYYDPSGVVRDGGGNPIAGATVTLLRSDDPGGPFAAVANGSDTMSPDNRRNPDQTLSDGSYAWDVVGGYYKVQASKGGCTTESAVLSVPPPATGVDLVLDCRLDQVITVTTHAPATAVYGTGFTVAATAPGGTVTFSASGACSNVGDLFTMTTGTGTCTVEYDQGGDTGYKPAPRVAETVTAQKAGQGISVTAHAPASAAFGAGFTVAASAPGGPVTFSSAGACSNVGAMFTMNNFFGTCSVRYDQAGDLDYDPAPQVVETVSALAANQAIHVTTHAPANATFGTSFTVAATGGASGTPITFSSAGACSNVGSVFTMTSGTGTCSVKYDQAGEGPYNPAPQVVETVSAQRASQAITVTTPAPATAAVGSGFTVAASAPGGAVTYSSAGACTNSGAVFTVGSVPGTCTVRFDQPGNANYAAAAQVVESVTVPTPKFTVEVQLAGTGAGTVTSSPSGIACGSTCTADFDAGTTVTLSAAAGSGSTFAGWSGACAGSGACVLTRAGTVVAAFAHAPPPPSVKCVVPNVKGKPLATAKRKIGAAHCTTGRITQAKSKTVKKGNVISQTPKPGKKLARGAKVNLVVSRGKR